MQEIGCESWIAAFASCHRGMNDWHAYGTGRSGLPRFFYAHRDLGKRVVARPAAELPSAPHASRRAQARDLAQPADDREFDSTFPGPASSVNG